MFNSDVRDISPNDDLLLVESVANESKTRSLNLNNLNAVQNKNSDTKILFLKLDYFMKRYQQSEIKYQLLRDQQRQLFLGRCWIFNESRDSDYMKLLMCDEYNFSPFRENFTLQKYKCQDLCWNTHRDMEHKKT